METTLTSSNSELENQELANIGKNRPSIAARVALAIGLMIGFYLLALLIAGGLLYLIYAEVAFTGHINIRLTIFLLLGAGVILWSIIPRPDKFVAPGPRLDAADQPELFAQISDVAKRTGQAMPSEVYLVPDVNAWVAQRGGLLGIGSRRVMGIGLPLLQMLKVSEFRAVLAHEFGHYYGGDTRLGPLLYRTRSAIFRSLHNLSGYNSLLHAPFTWYAKLFLRVSHAVSRRQEFVADEVAARTIGAEAVAGGLRSVHGSAMAFDAYWRLEVVPVLNSGYRPPLSEGFSRFASADNIVEAVSRGIEKELAEGQTDPYDTHPPLRERLAALKDLPPGKLASSDPLAITLLADVEQLEHGLFVSIADEAEVNALRPIDWASTAETTYIPGWVARTKDYSQALSGVSVTDLPAEANMWSKYGKDNDPSGQPVDDPDMMKAKTISVLGAALCIVLYKNGWQVRALPGESVVAVRGEMEIKPFDSVEQMASRALSHQEWEQQCKDAGISDLILG